ncbi:MAG: cytochrome c biogenesis heme-transporting ATPase CcmA [Pseudomonadota bacterium]|nr:cytochrome c biogenesis heme-transporting ATPase CcmA [Pseudomonadota bacterium]
MASEEKPLLAAVDLCCVRSDRLLFQGLGFALRPGTLIKVAGPNGAGKTSLLRILAGLAQPEDGEVQWRGQPIAHHAAEYATDRRYLGHHNGHSLALTVRENLRVAAALQGVEQSAAERDVILETVGLAHVPDTPVARLSSGQRRRLALARLLLGRAGVWILDEPLNALDRAGQTLVNGMLAEHLSRQGVAVVSTHHPLALPSPARQQTLTLAAS